MTLDPTFRRPNPVTAQSPTFTGTATMPRIRGADATDALTITPWINLEGTFPGMSLLDTDGSANQKRTQIYANDATALAFRTVTDTNTVGEEFLSASRSGTTVGQVRMGGTSLTLGPAGGIPGAGTIRLQVRGSDFASSSAGLARYDNNNDCCYIVMAKTRGPAIGDHAAVQAGDFLGRIQFRGGDGSSTVVGASLYAIAGAPPSGGILPTAVVIENGGATRLRIGADGTTSIGGAIGTESLRVLNGGSSVNCLQIAGAASGGVPTLSAQGATADLDIGVTPKGTGHVRFGTHTATSLSPTGYIEIKDAGGTVRRLLVG